MQPLVPHIDGCQKGVVDHRQQFQRLDGWLRGPSGLSRLRQQQRCAGRQPRIESVKAGMNEVVAVLFAQALPFRVSGTVKACSASRQAWHPTPSPVCSMPGESNKVGWAGRGFTRTSSWGDQNTYSNWRGSQRCARTGCQNHGQADYIRYSMMGAGVAVDRTDSVIDACQQRRSAPGAFRQQGVDAVSHTGRAVRPRSDQAASFHRLR